MGLGSYGLSLTKLLGKQLHNMCALYHDQALNNFKAMFGNKISFPTELLKRIIK